MAGNPKGPLSTGRIQNRGTPCKKSPPAPDENGATVSTESARPLARTGSRGTPTGTRRPATPSRPIRNGSMTKPPSRGTRSTPRETAILRESRVRVLTSREVKRTYEFLQTAETKRGNFRPELARTARGNRQPFPLQDESRARRESGQIKTKLPVRGEKLSCMSNQARAPRPP